MPFDNRVTRMLGVQIPIVQAPMGFIAKPPLVSAVANAGAIGLVPGSLGLDEVREDIRQTRAMTAKPFGRLAGQTHQDAQGSRAHRVPRRAVAQGCAEGCRRRR
jgi:NAD(P)H-dependent flavin oxidoreductase YrpB (nitropropane dioxygenase family)